MSTDFNVVCDTCKLIHHLGQRSGAGSSFGYGSRDAAGRKIAANFVIAHLEHGEDLRIEIADTAERRRSDGYFRADDSSRDLDDESSEGSPP
jgi:hypothetical protein